MIDTSKKLLLLSFSIFFLILTLNNFYKITLGSYSSSNIEKVKSETSLLKSSIEILELENRILEVEIASFSDEDEAIIGLARSERGSIKKGEQLVEFK
jgi:cell division protein FtsB